MRTKHSIVIACVLALALAAAGLLAAPARATFPGRNGLITFSAPVPGHYQIFVMNPDGSGLRQVTHGTSCAEPSISPDGKTIVFEQATASTEEIRVITTTGANSRHLASRGNWPSFSPDGRRVVFLSDNQVWVMNANGSHQRRLTALGSHRLAYSPTYSPNGKTIVFLAQSFGVHITDKVGYEILAMNADGSHLRRLAFSTRSNNRLLGPPPLAPSFSPDGKKIVFGAWADNGESILRVMNADGTHQRLLPRSYGFTWPCYSPDGRKILCLNSHFHVSVASADGAHWWRLTDVSYGVRLGLNWGPHTR